MLAPFPLVTTDRSGRSRSFQVSVETDDGDARKIYVTALEDGVDPKAVEGFQMTLKPLPDGRLRIDAITAHTSHRRAGIPDSLLPELSRRFGKNVVSSSNRFPASPEEFRSIDAEKMWKRLVQKGIATHDVQQDRYSCS
jgi:hypothetical protein